MLSAREGEGWRVRVGEKAEGDGEKGKKGGRMDCKSSRKEPTKKTDEKEKKWVFFFFS